jgi:hypothetical protein
LPSVVLFAECLLSGTRQRRVCRVPHSVKLDARQRVLYRVLNTRHRGLSAKSSLPSVKHSANEVLGKGPSAAVPKLTAVSLCREPTAGTRQRVFFAECHIPGARQRTLCRVSSLDTRQNIFLFFYFVSQNFCGMFLHYVDLHVSFVDNFNRVFNR